MKTWHVEMLFVATMLVALTQPTSPVAVLTTAAVLLSFAHAQVADRLREAEGARPAVSVACIDRLDRYWTGKEVLWALVFVASRNWPALLGCMLLGLYPTWRRFWRAVHPRPPST